MMGTSKRNKQVGDVGPRWRRPTAALAGKFEHGALKGERQNALTYQLFDALRALFEEVEASDADRVLVLQGVPGAFSSGMDLADRADADAPAPGSPEAMARIHSAALALHEMTTPSVAAVDGLAAGFFQKLGVFVNLPAHQRAQAGQDIAAQPAGTHHHPEDLA